ncbi:MAG: hypothetical protein KDE48_15575 [Anaerolineales bacterium]|nr:hypothetical protein [Anaerolineales bacterium]
MVRPVRVDGRSPFFESTCALCKAPFDAGSELVVCPQDGALHHVHCWQANANSCSAYGCKGAGEITRGRVRRRPQSRATDPTVPTLIDADMRRRPYRSKVRTMPSRNFGCRRGCFSIGILMALAFFMLACFGLWAVVDYVVNQMPDIEPNIPFTGMIWLMDLQNLRFLLPLLVAPL